MRRRVAAVALGLLPAVGAGAQPPTSAESFTAGRARLAAGDSQGAADAFHAALLGVGSSRHTVRLGVYCDTSNLERQVRAGGDAPELFVLRRQVGGRPCLALYWGLFPSRAAARSALGSIPAALRAGGPFPVAVSGDLPAGAPPARAAAVPPAAPPAAVPVPPPAEASPTPEAAPEPRTVEAPAAVPPPPVSPLVPEAPAPALPPPEPVRVPAVELEAGYSALWDDGLSGTDGQAAFGLGWILSGCASLGRGVGLVGEVSGHYDSAETLDDLGGPLGVDRDLLGVHLGPRYTHRTRGFALPYVQVLAGWTRTGLDAAGRREVEDGFSVQPGVGLLLRLSRGVGIAGGADYRLVLGSDESRNELRLHAGLVFAIGERD